MRLISWFSGMSITPADGFGGQLCSSSMFGIDRDDFNLLFAIYSPDLIWASTFNYKLRDNFKVQLISKYVGDQYIDNTSSTDRMLDAYIVHIGRFSWDINSNLFSSAKLTFQVNNLLDEKYANNAWVYRFISEGWDPTGTDPYVNANNEGGYDMAGYFPQAGRNFLIGISLGL